MYICQWFPIGLLQLARGDPTLTVSLVCIVYHTSAHVVAAFWHTLLYQVSVVMWRQPCAGWGGSKPSSDSMLNASAVSIPCNLVKQASESALSWRAFDQAGTSQPDASPESPRLFGSPILPETPPAQIMKPPQTAPPVRRARSMNTPPVASHPVLASAFAVARTAAPDSDQLPARSPTQRQLQLGPLFSFPSSQTHQPTPFAFAASKLEPPSLLDKVNSLPGPKDVLQAVLLQRQNSLSCQDSGMLSHMLQRSAQLHSKRDGPAAASSTGSASR